MSTDDTIAAVSSATGPAARMIVRLSGPDARRVSREVAPDLPDRPNAAERLTLAFRGMRVPAWAYVFRAPRSYTGEDLVELHVPGNPLLARLLLQDLLARGARPAEAGEFTARAYFNGRLDLTGAEGVAATIAAGNEAELAAARQLMAGELARRLRPALDAVAGTLALVEAGIDFSDEDVSFLSPREVGARAAGAEAALRDLLAGSSRFERLTHEPHLVLAGRPNAGKSTLLNALAGRARAVTSPAAGTTRDALTAEVALRRGSVRLTDVPGLEDEVGSGEAPAGPAGEIARQMREHALRAAESAGHLVLVREAGDRRPPPALPRPADLVVVSKSDLMPGRARGPSGEQPGGGAVVVSALSGAGVDALRLALDELAFGRAEGGSVLALNARHLGCIDRALAALGRAGRLAGDGSPELVALELREALDALGEVLGHVSPDDLLGRIFSSFCIGK